MQRRHGGKHVGIAGVDPMEKVYAKKLVHAVETRGGTGHIGVELKTVFGHIPRWGGGIEVINAKADKVGQEKTPRKAEEQIAVVPIQPHSEQHGKGHPRNVKNTRQYVQKSVCMEGAPLI